MKVLEQATKVLCLAEEACDKTTKGDWQPYTYQRYRWRMDQEVGHLYALFGGPEEDEVRVKGQRLAKAWLAKAHDSVEGAREHMGLQLRRASKLNVARQCQHDGPPAESRPCEEQARTAIQRADCAWIDGPRRMRELCGEYPDTAGWPTRGTASVRAPGGGSEFSPGPADDRSDSDTSESSDSDSYDSETGDSDSSGTETEDPAPFDVEVRRLGCSHLTRAAQIPPLPTRRSRALQQVRRFLVMLTRMRKDLAPSARIEVIRELGWHLGSSCEPGRASRGDHEPEPAGPPEGTSWIMNYLEDWRRIYEDGEERRRAVREEVAAPDDSLACAEERLAAKRAAELEERAKGIERRLLITAARLSILWSEVTGSGRPAPSEIQLTSTGTEMTTEEHVATAETHLRYAEGHLQPSEEHLADAEVHLKLAKAHLAALAAAKLAEAGPQEAAILLPPEPAGSGVGAERVEVAPEERDRSPATRPRGGSAQRGRKSAEGTPHPGAGEDWVCPVGRCQDSAAHHLDECGEFRSLSVTQRRKAIKEWDRCECCLTDCRDRRTGTRCYRRIGFRRHHLLRLAAQPRATPDRGNGRRQQQPRGEARGAGRDLRNVPHGRPGQTNGGRSCGRGQGTPPQERTATCCFPAVGRNRELVWLRATRSQHVGVTRITHQAAIRLGLPQSVTEAYQVRLKLSGEPRFVLRAEGVETLKCVRTRDERSNAMVLQPDVIIGWSDWSKVQPFAMSGWAIPGQTLPGATAPATKWHLRLNRRGNPPVYLNVQLDPMRKRSTITQEVVVRTGEPFEPFYMLFARTEAGEVGSLVAVGAYAIVRADRRRPADPAERGPDILLDAKDTRNMAKYLRAGWKSEQEIGGRGGCPVSGQWHGKLKGRQVLRDPGWMCVQYVRTGRTREDIFLRVMFDTIRERTIILHSVAVKLGLRASRGPVWLSHRGEDSSYSSCEYELPVLDWKGRNEWIKARGVSYTTLSEQRDMPKGAREAFPEIAWASVTVSQGAGPVDMIIGRDNPEWMPVPVPSGFNR